MNNINLNKSKIQHCETVLDLRNSFEEMYEVTIYFNVTHMTDFRNKMARFAFPCLTKAIVSCDLLKESESNDVKEFVQMYQFNADLFDFVTPVLLYTEVFKKKEDPLVEDQSEGLSKIEARVLQDELYDVSCKTLAPKVWDYIHE